MVTNRPCLLWEMWETLICINIFVNVFNFYVAVFLLQTKTEEVMMVSSKYKQLYECRLPAQALRFYQDSASEPESHGYTGPDIPDLLSPMQDAPCLLKVGCSSSAWAINISAYLVYLVFFFNSHHKSSVLKMTSTCWYPFLLAFKTKCSNSWNVTLFISSCDRLYYFLH